MNKALCALLSVMVCVCTVGAADTIVDEAKLQALKAKNVVLQDPVLSIKGAIEKPQSYILKLEAQSPKCSHFITEYIDKKTD